MMSYVCIFLENDVILKMRQLLVENIRLFCGHLF